MKRTKHLRFRLLLLFLLVFHLGPVRHLQESTWWIHTLSPSPSVVSKSWSVTSVTSQISLSSVVPSSSSVSSSSPVSSSRSLPRWLSPVSTVCRPLWYFLTSKRHSLCHFFTYQTSGKRELINQSLISCKYVQKDRQTVNGIFTVCWSVTNSKRTNKQ